MERGVSTWSVPICYKQGRKIVQLSSVRAAVKRGLERVKLKNLQLLEIVARERLVKTQKAEKRLSGCCGDL
jgi:hypothetical protein